MVSCRANSLPLSEVRVITEFGRFVVARHQTNLRRYATMDKSNVVKLTSRDTIIDPLTELLRAGIKFKDGVEVTAVD